MNEDKYHHKDLKKQLIESSIYLLNNEGAESFSLRKVAKMCGVSHAAPYKHFKNKEELINETFKEVWKDFYLTLLEVKEKNSENPKLQLIELGKAYVKYMVDNPEYLKFMFLSQNNCSVKVKNNSFVVEDMAFKVFKESSEKYYEEINLDKELYMSKTLAMWSLVHGLTILITQKNLVYEGSYIDLVENIIKNNI